MQSCAIRNGNRVERVIASGKGRAARVVLGTGFIAAGLTTLPMPAGLAVATFGLLPITTGALNLCPIAPAWHGHFFGSRYNANQDE